ncbi:MAG TPA: motility protein A [Candidatus Krumholzibacteria bacterium]|nr:motility protein A [Candidatus Krumholzibacteria bacterium]HPD71620.1 motility protein A [Candidatus Krumholzibacteria bacterium]HRY41447.1 motility protein A [Candidatus Krumholzibacteria bacterium]
MDFGTVIGIILAFGLSLWGIKLGGSLTQFWDLPSVAIVFGGVAAVLLIAFPVSKVLGMLRVLRNAFLTAPQEPAAVIATMVRYAERARREGMLALEEESENEPDEFLRKGLRLAVDGTDPQLLEKILETDIGQIEARHKNGKAILDAGGYYSPAFGMIGTLIGLVNMLSTMDDPSAIGAGMATALITTFYGAMAANCVFLPLANKLEVRSGEEILVKEMIIDGIMAIQSGDSPRIVEEKLKSFLSPMQRHQVENGKQKAA